MANMNNTMSKMEIENTIKTAVQELENCFMQMKCFFGDCADLSTFLNLRGFKRKFEYKQCCFLMLSRKLHRMAIEQLGLYVDTNNIDYKKIEVVSRNMFNNDRLDAATENAIKTNTKEMFDKWLDAEYEMAEKFKNLWYSLLDLHDTCAVVLANFVKCLLDDTTRKIKYIERKIMDYESIGYSPLFIKMHDAESHDHYREKLKTIDKIISK